MELRSLLAKLGEMEQTAAEPAAEATTIKEARIKGIIDVLTVLDNLRKFAYPIMANEESELSPSQFASRVYSALERVSEWLKYEAKIREDVTTEAKKPDFLDVDKDGDKEEPMSKAIKDKEKVDEAMVVQADGSEAMALLGILKLAGMPAPQPAAEEREVELANTPSEHEFPHDAAVPAGTDLHKQKGAYRAAAGADNAMAVEELNKLEGKLKGMFESMIESGE